MKRTNFFLLTISLIFLTTVALAAELVYRWGGPGFDPALTNEYSSRFAAHPHFQDNSLLDILVDAKETVEDVGHMSLAAADEEQISSDLCGKDMLDMDAPWACTFPINKIQALTGMGKIDVFSRAGELLLSEEIDFDALHRRLEQPTTPPTSNNQQLIVPQVEER